MIALYGLERKRFLEKRIQFLQNHTMTVYEPVDAELFEEIRQDENNNQSTIKDSNVILLSTKLDSSVPFEEDDEDPIWFTSAEPEDHLVANLQKKIPRFYSSYLIPANDFQTLLYLEESNPPEILLITYSLTSINSFQIYDTLKRKWMEPETFIKKTKKEELLMEIPDEERWNYLKNYYKQLGCFFVH